MTRMRKELQNKRNSSSSYHRKFPIIRHSVRSMGRSAIIPFVYMRARQSLSRASVAQHACVLPFRESAPIIEQIVHQSGKQERCNSEVKHSDCDRFLQYGEDVDLYQQHSSVHSLEIQQIKQRPEEDSNTLIGCNGMRVTVQNVTVMNSRQ